MEPAPETADETDPSRLKGELRLVREAVLMVVSNSSPRVVVAGLLYGNLIADACEHLARQSGVRIVPLRSAATGRLDFAVERGITIARQPAPGWSLRPVLEGGR
jgi:hypothetical protein